MAFWTRFSQLWQYPSLHVGHTVVDGVDGWLAQRRQCTRNGARGLAGAAETVDAPAV
jgi:hypothetical protein